METKYQIGDIIMTYGYDQYEIYALVEGVTPKAHNHPLYMTCYDLRMLENNSTWFIAEDILDQDGYVKVA